MSKKKNEVTAPDSPEAMLAIIERAQSGDEEAMPALREMLDRVPSIPEVLGAGPRKNKPHPRFVQERQR